MACGVFLLGLFFLGLSIIPSSASNGGLKAQDSWLSQPQRPVSVVIGETLHLECEVSNNHIAGGVKWFLGEGPRRKLIFTDAQIDGKDERISRNSPGSDTDFSISMCNVTLEDAGTYYCVKEKKDGRGATDWLKGRGTRVVVEGIKAQDSWLSQPQSYVSVVIGETLHLECEASNNPIPGGVKWFLGGGPQRKLIYSDSEIDGKGERISRNSPGSDTDFSISIRNVTLEDAGTYYCVKEKRDGRGTTDWLKGSGTRVIVDGLEGQSIYGLYLGLFLNKVSVALLLFGLFQIKQHRCCLARYLAKCSPV